MGTIKSPKKFNSNIPELNVFNKYYTLSRRKGFKCYILSLSPFLKSDGLLRVGRHSVNSNFNSYLKH